MNITFNHNTLAMLRKKQKYMSTNCQKENQMRFVTTLFVIRRNTSNTSDTYKVSLPTFFVSRDVSMS